MTRLLYFSVENTQSKTSEMSSAISRAIDQGKGSIQATATLNDQLFVSYLGLNYVYVYNTTTFKLLNRTTFTGLGTYISGLAASVANMSLYISDFNNNAMHRVSLPIMNPSEVMTWKVPSSPEGLSINSAHNVLVALPNARMIQEYTSNGSLVRHVSDSNNLHHAVELMSIGTWAVSRAVANSVIMVSAMSGNVTACYGCSPGPGVGLLSSPRRLAVDKDGYVLVSDEGRNQILVINPSLTDSRQLPLPNNSLNQPYALSLDQSRGLLYVGENSGLKRLVVIGNITSFGELFTP